MIRQLQHRFIRIALIALTVAMVLVTGIVNLVNWLSVRNELIETLSYLVENVSAGQTIMEFFLILGCYNAFLCIFNLLPVPGLDGWAALTEYVPRMKSFSSEFAKGVTIFLIFLFLFLSGRIFLLAFKLMELAPALFGAE